MANGKPGDHPLTDILFHGRPRYSGEADDLIRKIARLSSSREVHQWREREIGWKASAGDVLFKAQTRYAELLERARTSGWELPEGAG
jgi:hypothetical protein